jgi:hypothetical protein
MSISYGLACTLALLLASDGDDKSERGPVVIYGGVTSEVTGAKVQGNDLWIPSTELTGATKLELKPQGVCTDKTCVPLPKERHNEFVKDESGRPFLNLSEFARLVRQPVAHNTKHQVWFFGPRPGDQNSHVASLMAPDFTLLDLNGKTHSLSDFRGKKVLLITWGSW